MAKKTDLALEARELWQEQAGQTTRLPGVRVREHKYRDMTMTVVDVLDHRGARALNKPVGTYTCLEFSGRTLRDRAGFGRAAVQIGKALAGLVPQSGPVLVAGLGNPAVTPDSLGPRTLSHLLVTRHLGAALPRLRAVSAISPGVLGVTGLESVEVVRGVVERAQPVCVVAVDALASRDPERLCTTVQLSDTGIVPGSGVRNSRAAFDQARLGVPVIAVGVPTVVDGPTFANDLLQQTDGSSDRAALSDCSLVLTPRDIDTRTGRMARLLGYGISLGLHRELTLSDIVCLLE